LAPQDWPIFFLRVIFGVEVAFVVREQRAIYMRRFFKKIIIAAIALWAIVIILQTIHVLWMFR
jgi:hypothetical protein